ncbi:metallopeptidase TldD-related protein [Wolbachia endosymbiont of Howardula sp.]|uniref:metallopeptidase TldD-related protein n=1 Tax=Wolbachia endosymbiont of Howardula sp. TaxID=2916816 RepID=UPI00217CEAEF|nr:metallopeptidase TldD-related protein [Wolbachia endosymbiont of Howardula sp.]UWI83399.1 metallopeptidase TldD-related protein [Wolbachia endosymbiont of Howardula sp.]
MSDIDKIFFTHNNININNIYKIVNHALRNNDGGELFLEFRQSESLLFEDNMLKHMNYNTNSGFGLRAFCDNTLSFVCSSEISEQEISKATSIVINTLSLNQNNLLHLEGKRKNLYSNLNPIHQMSLKEKLTLLHDINEYIRSKSNFITQVKITLSGEYQAIQIIKGDNYRISDIRPLVRLNIVVIVEKAGRIEKGHAGYGRREMYGQCINIQKWQKVADEALAQALMNCEAMPMLAGEMTVVLSAGVPGILIHESVGHGLEGDFNRKKVSAFSHSIGKQIASHDVTIVDDGTLPYMCGSMNIDDEGHPSGYNILVENGILKGYIQDHMNAKHMNVPITGNGRRESYASIILPRMTNTYMLPGKYTEEEIISSVKKGVYGVKFCGGQVDITSGKFVFSSSEAYLIENGKITYPIKGVSFIGDGQTLLKKVSMVGNNLKLDTGTAICSKEGQNIPVCVGQPTIKVDGLTVGGTEL